MSFTGTYPNTIVLDTPSVQNPATVAATGVVQVTNADGIFGTAGYPWTLTNLGTVALLGSTGDGVHLTAGGLVTNGQIGASGASITAPGVGVEIDGASGTVNNFARISGPTSTGVGIFLERGGTVRNGAIGAGAPLISGSYDGIFAGSGPATIVNYGRIEAPGSIFNGGRAANVGVFLGAGGAVQNGSTGATAARIDGYHMGVFSGPLGGTITVSNFGTITATATHCNDGAGANGPEAGVGILLGAPDPVILNGGSGATSALIEGYYRGIGAGYYGTATVVNFGTIESTQTGLPVRYFGNAVVLHNGGTIINYGLIQSIHNGVWTSVGSTLGGAATITNLGTIEQTSSFAVINGRNLAPTAVELFGGGTVTNGQSGLSVGLIDAGWDGVVLSNLPGTVTNFGTIRSTGSLASPSGFSAAGVILEAGGTVFNGATGATSALIQAYETGIYVGGFEGASTGALGTVINYGTIKSTGAIGQGARFASGGSIVNHGVIDAAGIGVSFGTAAGTIDNFGTIVGTSGTAIRLGAGADKIIIEAGSSLQGAIGNFLPGDSFDLPFMPFSSSGSVSLATGNVLKVIENGGTFTIDLDPNQDFTNEVFRLASDGGSGTLVTVSRHYQFFAANQALNLVFTSDPNNVPAPALGNFNLEVITNATGTGSFSTASGYQGLAILSTDGHTLTLLHGDYGVVDNGGNDSIIAGDGNVSIGGAIGDTIIGGSGLSQFLDGHLGNQMLVGGIGGNETIWGGAGDTIQGGSGNATIGGTAGDTIIGGSGNTFIDADLGNQSVVGGNAGNTTIWGGAGDTIRGGAGNATIGGTAGDTIIGGSGVSQFLDGHLGNQSVIGGSSGNTTIWGGTGDTIQGGAGNVTIGGTAGDTIIGGIGNTFIDADLGNQSVIGGSAGNTTIWGGAGDTIRGGSGNTTIGGAGGDTIIGGTGNTFIDAHNGSESITAGSGNTTVWGGSADTIQGASGTGSAIIAFGAVHSTETLWDDGATSSGNDTVVNFSQSSGDRISISAADQISGVLASATTTGGNTTITLSDGSHITLIGIAAVDNSFFTTH
jgi:hypothetical protein